MNQPIPNNQTIELQVTRMIEEFQVEYIIRTTALGEVMAVTCLLLDLPRAAQRLMFGTKYEQLIATVKAMSGLFSYELPLVAMGYLKGEEWKTIADKLAAFRQQQPIITITNIQSPWVRQAYQLHQKSAPNEDLMLAAEIISPNLPNKRYTALKIYDLTAASYKSNIIGPFLLQLLLTFKVPSIKLVDKRLPRHRGGSIILSPFMIHAIYRTLATYPSNSAYLILSNRLNNPDYKIFHTSILHGLLPYKAAAHQEVLANYYKTTPSLNGEGLDLFLKGVANLPLTQQKELLFTILISENREASNQVYRQLQGLDFFKEEELAKKLYVVFKEKCSLEKMCTILKAYGRVTNKENLPTSTELLGVLEWFTEQGKDIDLRIIYGLTNMLTKRLDEQGFLQLLELLKHQKTTVREAALKQLTNLLKEKQVPLLVAILTKIKEPIQKSISSSLEYLLNHYSHKEPLVLSLGETDTLKKEVVNAIRQVLIYQKKINRQRQLRCQVYVMTVNSLLQGLTHTDPRIRRVAAKDLGIFEEFKVILALEKIVQQDSDALVRKIAKESLDSLNNLPKKRKLDQEPKEKIRKYRDKGGRNK